MTPLLRTGGAEEARRRARGLRTGSLASPERRYGDAVELVPDSSTVSIGQVA
jgi:hypothetical protein